MSTRALFALLATASLPTVVGDTRIAEFAQTTIDSGWYYGGQWRDSCYDQPMVITVEQVNQRFLITVEVPYSNVAYGPVAGQTGRSCELVFQTEPGHFRDPCTGVNGSITATPVISPSDPYFYFEPDGRWHHRVGSADFYFDRYYVWDMIDPPYYEAEFGGTCYLNGVYGSWQSYWGSSIGVGLPE